ncbi:PadR family transcriptional regulator [Cellulomonas citrea]|uniref:PadR family transcriptional regulator n=1 Tax=Cellulomonas citrea TaxID=1909423 RepID=UPI00135793B5|nr:PadR family transcriptional regulator [Cellulomonas citrea]
MTPVFAHGQLRLYLLALLEAGPRHGYEVIQALSDRFGGTYRPSAGTIYPRLGRLEEEGLVVRSQDGRKTTYSLTAAGRAELDARRGDLADLEADLAETVRGRAEQVRDDVRESMRGLRADLAAAAQQARASARPGRSQVQDDERLASHVRRVEAEALVRRFTDEIRADLRRADADGAVPQLALDTVRTVLDSALTAVRQTLH